MMRPRLSWIITVRAVVAILRSLTRDYATSVVATLRAARRV